MRKYLVKDPHAKFDMHRKTLRKKADAYVKGLPTGMTPSEDHKAVLLSKPHTQTCQASEAKTVSDKVKFMEEAKTDTTKRVAVAAGTAAEEAGAAAEEAKKTAENLAGVASTAAAAMSPTATAAAAPSAAGASSSSSAAGPTTATSAGAKPATNESTGSHAGKITTEVSLVQTVDIFGASWDPDSDPLKAETESAMLIFVNIGADPDLLKGTDDATKRLRNGLVALQSVLHPRGTMVIAMGPVYHRNFAIVEGSVTKACDEVLLYSLVAHKGQDFACYGHPAGNRRAGAASPSSFKSPRQAAFEQASFVVSAKHPTTATYLSHSMADHLINRFTVPGDSVVVTTFEENLIAPFVLWQGRLLSALVVDPAKATHADTEVDEACVAATKRGWFADLNKAKVRVFATTLPACVPSHNLSEETNRMYINAHEVYNSEDEDDDVEAALSAAGSLAEEIGFAIKEGSKLWLRPTRESFMFYVNSSFPRQEAANIERESSKLHKQPPSSADEAKELLADPSNGISFKLARAVKKGEELLGWYPLPTHNHADGGDQEGGATGSRRRGKRERRFLRSSTSEEEEDGEAEEEEEEEEEEEQPVASV
ncbi:unnamed protein product [Ectocarpus sp. CCAP 1310/34]|nr:unnamed protein product [Ectocarpus sp. CCAP 1310/34]